MEEETPMFTAALGWKKKTIVYTREQLSAAIRTINQELHKSLSYDRRKQLEQARLNIKLRLKKKDYVHEIMVPDLDRQLPLNKTDEIEELPQAPEPLSPSLDPLVVEDDE